MHSDIYREIKKLINDNCYYRKFNLPTKNKDSKKEFKINKYIYTLYLNTTVLNLNAIGFIKLNVIMYVLNINIFLNAYIFNINIYY